MYFNFDKLLPCLCALHPRALRLYPCIVVLSIAGSDSNLVYSSVPFVMHHFLGLVSHCYCESFPRCVSSYETMLYKAIC